MISARFLIPLILVATVVFYTAQTIFYFGSTTIADDAAPFNGLTFEKTPRKYWPTNSWQTASPEETGLSSAALKKAENYAFDRTGNEQNREGIRTDGLVIIKNGYLVYEKYHEPYNKDTKHLIWSVSKSFVNTFIGIAIKEGLMTLQDSAGKYYEPLRDNEKSKITIDHLLQMRSGLYWDEGYESSPLRSTVVAMLYTRGSHDMADFAAKQSLEHDPGTRWYYSSGTSNILMAVLKAAVGKQAYNQWPWQKLFNVIGMNNVTFEQDKSGTFIGSSYIYAPPQELAKFGFLYLNRGEWEGNQLLPSDWLKYTTTMSKAYYTTRLKDEDLKENPAAHWYINVGIPEKEIPPPWPDAPKDTFSAWGHWGQFIVVIPSYDMVIVRVGDDRHTRIDMNRLIGLILDRPGVGGGP